MDGYEQINETHRLRIVAAQRRLRAVQTQLSVAFSYCSMGEAALRYRHFDQAQKLIENARHIAQTVQRHIAEPDHVPPDQINKLLDELRRLDSRVEALEAQLKTIS